MVEPRPARGLFADHPGGSGSALRSELGGLDGPLYGLCALWRPRVLDLGQWWGLYLECMRSGVYPLRHRSQAHGKYERRKLLELDGNALQCPTPLVRLPILLNDHARGVRAGPSNLY